MHKTQTLVALALFILKKYIDLQHTVDMLFIAMTLLHLDLRISIFYIPIQVRKDSHRRYPKVPVNTNVNREMQQKT